MVETVHSRYLTAALPFSPIYTRFVSEPPFTVLNTIHSKQLMLSTGRFSYTSPLSGLSLKILGLLPITTCHSTCVTSVAPTRYAVKLTGYTALSSSSSCPTFPFVTAAAISTHARSSLFLQCARSVQNP